MTVQAVLQLLGAVEEEALFRIGDLIVDGDTAGLLSFVEELADQGQDLNRLVPDLLEHLRHLLLVQHMGEVPDSLPVTEETRERLRSQANQLGEPDRAAAHRPARGRGRGRAPGRRPAPPLELALVKVTRPGADLSRESSPTASTRSSHGASETPTAAAGPRPPRSKAGTPGRAPSRPRPPPEAARSTSSTCSSSGSGDPSGGRERSIPLGSVLNEAKPVELAGERLTVEFPRPGRSTGRSPRSRERGSCGTGSR